MSGCPVLEILEVRNYCGFNRLEVTSPSLREFCLSSFEHPFDEDDDDDDDDNDDEDAYLAISAPNLRVLTISSRFYVWNVRLEDVKSLVVADLSFNLVIDDTVEDFDKCSDLLQELLEKLHHVKELKLANWCIQVRNSSGFSLSCSYDKYSKSYFSVYVVNKCSLFVCHLSIYNLRIEV